MINLGSKPQESCNQNGSSLVTNISLVLSNNNIGKQVLQLHNYHQIPNYSVMQKLWAWSWLIPWLDSRGTTIRVQHCARAKTPKFTWSPRNMLPVDAQFDPGNNQQPSHPYFPYGHERNLPGKNSHLTI